MNIEEHLPEDNLRIHFLNSPYNFYKHKILFYEFDDVVLNNGIFVDSQKKPLLCTLDEQIFWNPRCISYLSGELLEKEADSRIKNIEKISLQKPKEKICLRGQYVDLTHAFGRYAFGHIFDTLQRLSSIPEDILEDKTVKFLVGDYSLICCFKEHLSILCKRKIKDSDLIICNKNNSYSIQRVYYGISPAVTTTFSRFSYKWIIERYYDYFDIKKIQPNHNLYCNRNHIRSNSRGVINNNEVIEFLSNKGFVVLNGNENLKEIVNYFANANAILGSHGSLLANSMFCGPEAKIIEFCPKTRIDKSFLLKFKMAKNYKQIILDSDDHHNVTLPIQEIEKYL